jgi:tetratricopeptide (TPR) repeat protein
MRSLLSIPCVALALLLTAPTSAHAQSVEQPAAARDTAISPDRLAEYRRRFAAGRALLEASPPDYNAALAEFQRAYDLLAGNPRRYLALSNIAHCYQALGQYDRAMEFYERYLREGGPEAEDRVQVEASIGALRDILGSLQIRVNVAAAEVWVDNRRVGSAPGEVRIPGGRHVVELRARGYAPSQQPVELASRQSVPLVFNLEALGSAGLRPTFFWITAGLAAAAVGTGAVFGGLALSARSDVDTRLQSANEMTRFSVSEDDARHIRTLSLTADVLYASGAALGIGATILLFLTDWNGGSREGAPRAAARRLPVVVPTSGGLQLVGTF